MSLNMLIETLGGVDYTGADCCAWMQEAGFLLRFTAFGRGVDPWKQRF